MSLLVGVEFLTPKETNIYMRLYIIICVLSLLKDIWCHINPHRGVDYGHTVETLCLYVFEELLWAFEGCMGSECVLARRSVCIGLSVILYNGSSVCAH